MGLNIPSPLIVLTIVLSILAFANATLSPKNGAPTLMQRMLAKEKEANKAAKLREKAEMEQVEPQERSLFLNQNIDKNIVGTDYLEGKQLTSDQMEKVQTRVFAMDGLLDINGNIPGLTPPLLVNWVELADCASGMNPVFLLLRICVDMAKACKDGIAMCFVGKMDPIYSPHVEPNFVLKNLDGKLDKRCDKANKMLKFWEKKELHSVLFSSPDGQTIEIQASFTQMHHSLEPNPDGCVEMLIASEGSLIGLIHDGGDKNFVGQDLTAFLHKMGNGDALANQDLASSLPFDLLGKFYNKYSPHLPLFAFAGSNECAMDIKIAGPLKRCADQKCTSIVDIPNKPGEQQKAFYHTEFDNMKPINKLEDMPSQYSRVVFFELNPEDSLPRAIIETQGNEITFAVLTRNLTPPAMTFLFPQDAMQCTIKKNFDVNEFVLAYNGRPDCYFRIAVGERKFRFRDSMGIETEILGIKDMHVNIEGSNGDEFWGIDQYGDKQMLGRGTCIFQATRLAKPLEGLKLHRYRWDFIINPKKNENVPIVGSSKCKMATAFNLVDYRIMLGDVEDAKTAEETSDEETEGTSESPDEIEL